MLPSDGVYFAPRYFAARYFAPRYFPGGGLSEGVHFAPRHFAGRHFAPRHFPGRPHDIEVVPIRGTSTWVWTDSPEAIEPELLIDGTSVWAWTAPDEDAGIWQIDGTSARFWFGGMTGEPADVFRVRGEGEWLWRLEFRCAITGRATFRWYPAVGIADECLVADGDMQTPETPKNHVY